MADWYDELNDELIDFIHQQQMYVTGSAPLTADGHINVSPKGMDTFRVIDTKTVGYLDLTGSGNETAAHINENGRLTIMLCSYTQRPWIMRLYGTGRNILPDDAEWADVSQHFELLPGYRQIVLLDIKSVQTSCGYGVPFYEYKEDRQTLVKWGDAKGRDGILDYQREKNTTSNDGHAIRVSTK
jgi:hypothetical protein